MTVANFFDRLDAVLVAQKTLLCVGLDPDPSKNPEPLRRMETIEAVRTFLEGIVEATRDHCAAYKFQFGAFLAYGPEGVGLIPPLVREIGPGHVRVLDIKSGDIPNTMGLYGRGIFERMGFDAVTVSPYLGWESVEELAKIASKGVFVLAHTSNPGAKDLQERPGPTGRALWEEVLDGIAARRGSRSLGAVVGATFPEALAKARNVLGPEVPLLVPGVGAQGGDLQATLAGARGSRAGALLINSSRGILFASSGADWKDAAAAECRRLASACATARVGSSG